MSSAARGFGIVAVSAFVASACGPDGVVAVTDRSTYQPGSCVAILVTNPQLQDMYVDHCTPLLERQTATGWEPVPPPADGVCLLYGLGARAFGKAAFREFLPEDFPGGTYRYTVFVEWGASGEVPSLPTEPFTVSTTADSSGCPDDPFGDGTAVGS